MKRIITAVAISISGPSPSLCILHYTEKIAIAQPTLYADITPHNQCTGIGASSGEELYMKDATKRMLCLM